MQYEAGGVDVIGGIGVVVVVRSVAGDIEVYVSDVGRRNPGEGPWLCGRLAVFDELYGRGCRTGGPACSVVVLQPKVARAGGEGAGLSLGLVAFQARKQLKRFGLLVTFLRL